ncbi:phage holin family protein [Ligaoa zhengdingensis]|uniref:phage holin family protein n=1 Tax=Ligaoa zhengdingensis TaxID=2763658 RepID=UPI0031BA7FE1
MNKIMSYIRPELLVLIPVLYLLGAGLKKARAFVDKYIPLALGAAGVLLAVVWVLATTDMTGYKDVLQAVFVALTQGILAAGCSVYANQLVKQSGKDE